jgi:hypothetical protein
LHLAGTANLEEAVIAFRAALEVFTPEGSPRYHEMAQANLARVQSLLAERGTE